jgi:hypothetical protein
LWEYANEECGKIGENFRPLKKLKLEHWNDYRNRHKKDTSQTALIKHCKEKDHIFDFKNIKDLHHFHEKILGVFFNTI